MTQVAIVTGANTGIGKVTALELARKKIHVILACRSEERTKPAIEDIKKEVPDANVEFMALDLNSLKATNDFAEAFLKRKLPLNILVNNAGIMALPKFTPSADNIEAQFATNHLGHFLLTLKLLPVLIENQPSRIVNVSSKAHEMQKGPVEYAETLEDKNYSAWSAYARSKMANVLFTKELNRRLSAKNIDKVYVNALHPGVIHTELGRNLTPILRFFWKPITYFLMTPEKGAMTSIYAASDPEIEEKKYKGEYFIPIAKLSRPIPHGLDEKAAKDLWEFSVKVIKDKVDISVNY